MQAKAQLAAAVEALQKSSRPEDAAAVEEAIEAGQACGAGLQDDVASAQQALHRWQLSTNNEAKLAKALSDGSSVLGLSRAIQVCCACLISFAIAVAEWWQTCAAVPCCRNRMQEHSLFRQSELS